MSVTLFYTILTTGHGWLKWLRSLTFSNFLIILCININRSLILIYFIWIFYIILSDLIIKVFCFLIFIFFYLAPLKKNSCLRPWLIADALLKNWWQCEKKMVCKNVSIGPHCYYRSLNFTENITFKNKCISTMVLF